MLLKWRWYDYGGQRGLLRAGSSLFTWMLEHFVTSKLQVAIRRRRGSHLAWGLCVALVGLLWLAGPSFAVNDRMVYIKNLTLWGADTDGTNQQQISGPEETVETADLSPDGQTVVAANCCKTLYLYNFDTHARTLLYTESNGVAGFPAFSPDGKKIFFDIAGSSSSILEDIATINTDGTGFKKIITWKGTQAFPYPSPDGTKITFGSNTDSKGRSFGSGSQIFIANADGTSPVQVTTNSGGIVSGSYKPTFSPSGTTLAMESFTSVGSRIYTVSTDGTNLKQITTANGGSPDWSPDGSSIGFDTNRNKEKGYDLYTVNSTGGNEQPLITDPTASLEGPRYRHPSTTVHSFDYLASSFEPVLRFDSSEKWRPLNVESFFGEKQHHLCEGETCESEPLSGSAGLNKNRSPNAYINIAGTLPGNGGSAEEYHSPYAECTVNGLRDCDAGPRSAIYYRNPGVYGGYQYIDYWYFYRANYFFENIDFHEGDWEGATVAPSLEGDSFDYAAFSQHGTFYSYLRSVLRCENTPAASLPERGSCGAHSQRIDDLVANGDHANYTTPCKQELPTSCQQNGEGQVETGYDGTKRWGRAYNEAITSLLPMPAVGGTGWTDWPGKWGSPGVLPEEGSGPASPGNQAFKIECALIDNEPGCETGPRTASVRSPLASIQGGTARSPGLTAVSCANWAGVGIAAVACNPKELREAVLTGHVGSHGPVEISVPGGHGMSASGKGISQYSAMRPLVSGTDLNVRGRVTSEMKVVLRTYDARRKQVLLAVFKLAGATSDKARAARSSHRLELRLRIRRNRAGHLTLLLGSARAQRVSVVR